jgi:hypothetical protein
MSDDELFDEVDTHAAIKLRITQGEVIAVAPATAK